MSEIGKLFSRVPQHCVHRRSRPVCWGREADGCIAAAGKSVRPRRHGRRVTGVSTCPLRPPSSRANHPLPGRAAAPGDLALVGGDAWNRHVVPPTANPQILRDIGGGILDHGGARSQWLDSVHSSVVRSWPVGAADPDQSDRQQRVRCGRSCPRPRVAVSSEKRSVSSRCRAAVSGPPLPLPDTAAKVGCGGAFTLAHSKR
jgi:hypothetical protein